MATVFFLLRMSLTDKLFSKAMETLQLDRFEEFGYTYIAPR